jgi:hypothetical protein
MAYTTSQNASGLHEVFQDGQRVGTGDQSFAEGYMSRNQAAPAPTQPISRSIDPTAPTAANSATDPQAFLDTFRAPESREQIAERKRKESQGLIDSINKGFDDEVGRRQQIGQERVNMDNAISVLTGNAGGTESVRTRKTVLDANEKEVQAVNNQRALALQTVYTKISGDADIEAREQLADATRSAEQILARRKEAQAGAVENLKLMAASGLVDFDAFKSNPQGQKAYQYALESMGGDENALRAMFMLNRPQDQLVGEPVRMGGKFVQAYKNPITGKVTYEQLDLPFDLPPEYTNFQKMGDNLVAIPDGWDGDVSKLKTIVGQKSSEDMLREQSLRMDIALKSKALNETPGLTYEQREKEAAKAQAQDVAVKRAEEVKALVTKIKDSGSINAITGKWEMRRGLPGSNQDTLAELERLKALLAIDAIKDFKGLGPMSEREFGTASAAASALDVNRTAQGFTKELDRISTAMDTVSKGFSDPAAQARAAAIGSTVEINGMQYRKTGEDAYEPI